jgi:hypothetical protein
VRSRAGRIERFVTEWFACYDRGSPWIVNMYRERFLQHDLAHLIAHREDLAREVLVDDSVDQLAVWLIVAMTDFWVWKSLADRGMSAEVAAKVVAGTLVAALPRRRRRRRSAPSAGRGPKGGESAHDVT